VCSPKFAPRFVGCHHAYTVGKMIHQGIETERSRTRLVRIAGHLYLIVGIFGGFAEAYVPAKVYAPGDAATTAVLEDAPLLAMLLH
jgi:hypothetical protein